MKQGNRNNWVFWNGNNQNEFKKSHRENFDTKNRRKYWELKIKVNKDNGENIHS